VVRVVADAIRALAVTVRTEPIRSSCRSGPLLGIVRGGSDDLSRNRELELLGAKLAAMPVVEEENAADTNKDGDEFELKLGTSRQRLAPVLPNGCLPGESTTWLLCDFRDERRRKRDIRGSPGPRSSKQGAREVAPTPVRSRSFRDSARRRTRISACTAWCSTGCIDALKANRSFKRRVPRVAMRSRACSTGASNG
jgi:hypothetical protein